MWWVSANPVTYAYMHASNWMWWRFVYSPLYDASWGSLVYCVTYSEELNDNCTKLSWQLESCECWHKAKSIHKVYQEKPLGTVFEFLQRYIATYFKTGVTWPTISVFMHFASCSEAENVLVPYIHKVRWHISIFTIINNS